MTEYFRNSCFSDDMACGRYKRMMISVIPGIAAFRFLKLSTVAVFTFDDGTGAADILAAWNFPRSDGNSEKDDFDKQKIH